ncbi:MAG: type IV secretory system conjugative DNA transfer family protein [Bacilli bacterium]|nr:type IV secretory system conjugative DNA transfer family protein [Bacilli bacterium]
MNLSLLILLLFIVLFIIGFMYIEPIISKHKVKNNNEYGSARFSTESEINKYFAKERISNINEVGFPVYYDKNVSHVWFDKETPHYVYLGSSGSGKSVTCVINMVTFIANAKKSRSVFVTDPKGEIYQTTSKMLHDKGYKVLTIDFRHPELSNHINILEPIIREYENYIKYEKLANETNEENLKLEYQNNSISSYAETNRLITSLASMITYDKTQGKDPFWNNSAKNLLEGLIGFFLEEYKDNKIKREQITMTSIRKFQNSTMEDKNSKKFKFYIEQKPYGSKSKDSLIPILSSSENTYKSITSVFSEKMAIFDDVNVANVTSKSDFDFDILGKEKSAIFCIIPDEDKIYYSLVTIILGLFYKELVKLANSTDSKKVPIEIDWICDEFSNCPPLIEPSIESIISVARSRGLRYHLFIQSLSQLDNVYGKEVAQIILDNSGLAYLKTNTMDTAEAISKRLGKKTIEASSISQSVSLMNYNGNKSTSLIARDLLTPDEVKNLHYKTIIFPNIGYPIFRDTVIYKKLSCYSSGELPREITPLKDLSNTYFVVENIETKYDRLSRNRNNKSIYKEELSAYDRFKEEEIAKLNNIVEVIQNLLKDKINLFEYKENNNRTFASFELKEKLTTKELTFIKGKVNKEVFHVEIDNGNNTKSTIEIHLKNPLEIDNTLQKEITTSSMKNE